MDARKRLQEAAQEARRRYSVDIAAALRVGQMGAQNLSRPQDVLSMLSYRMESAQITPELAYLIYREMVKKYGMAEILKLFSLSKELRIIQDMVYEFTGRRPITEGMDKLIQSSVENIRQAKNEQQLEQAAKVLRAHFGQISNASNKWKLELAAVLKLHKNHQVEWDDVLQFDQAPKHYYICWEQDLNVVASAGSDSSLPFGAGGLVF